MANSFLRELEGELVKAKESMTNDLSIVAGRIVKKIDHDVDEFFKRVMGELTLSNLEQSAKYVHNLDISALLAFEPFAE